MAGRAKALTKPPVWPGLFWPGLARLTASGRAMHITMLDAPHKRSQAALHNGGTIVVKDNLCKDGDDGQPYVSTRRAQV
jgi:hypothetical protein